MNQPKYTIHPLKNRRISAVHTVRRIFFDLMPTALRVQQPTQINTLRSMRVNDGYTEDNEWNASFVTVNDTNVTITVGSAGNVHTITMGWAGVLAHGRGGTDVASPGASGNILTSNGTNWISAAPASTSHNLLSATHTDTLTASVVRGDLIVGNSTPKWSRLAIGANNRLLRSNGTDASWAQVALATDVSGILPHTQVGGGTVAGIAYFDSSGNLTNDATRLAWQDGVGVTDSFLILGNGSLSAGFFRGKENSTNGTNRHNVHFAENMAANFDWTWPSSNAAGYFSQNSSGQWFQRTFQAGDGILLVNADGAGGNTTISSVWKLTAGVISPASAGDSLKVVDTGGGAAIEGESSSGGGIGVAATGLGSGAVGLSAYNDDVAGTAILCESIGIALDAVGKIRGTGAVRTTSPSAPIGYDAGAGGTITQLTNKGTAVTLNKTTGQITTHNASLAAGAVIVFQVNNSTVAATDVPVLALASGGTSKNYQLFVEAVASGSFKIQIQNIGATLGEALVINFVILKGQSS